MPIASNISLETLPPWMEQAYKDLAEQSEAQRKAPYSAYPEWMKRYAEQHPDTLRSYELNRESMGEYKPYLEQSQQLYNQSAQEFPDAAERYMNPYTQQVIRNMQERSGEAFREQFLPQLENAFVGAGQHGSMRHQELAQRAARDQQRALNEQTNMALMQGYEHSGKLFNADAARKGEIAQGVGNLSTLSQAGRIADVAALQNQGMAQQAHEQGRLNLGAQDFNEQRNYPWNQLQQQSEILHGIPSQKQSYGASQTQGQPQWNDAGNLLNLAGNIYGATRGFGFGRKAGGSVRAKPKAKTMNIPKLKGLSAVNTDAKGKFKGLKAKKMRGLGNKPFTQSSFNKRPKVGAKSKMDRMKGLL